MNIFGSDVTGRVSLCDMVCDPVTIMVVASTAMSAMSSIKEGQAASSEAKYQSTIADQNATRAREQTNADLETQDKDRRLRRGASVASAGASGVGVDSFGDVMASSAMQEQLDMLTIKSNGLLAERGFEADASLAKARGANAKSASYLSAATSIIGGASNLYSPSGGASTYSGNTGSLGASSSRLSSGNTVTWNK